MRFPRPSASALLLFAGCLLGAPDVIRADDVPWTTIDLPAGAFNPRGAVDADGRVHIAYGREGKRGDAYYVRWQDGKLTEPVPINQNADVVVGGERGPQIAVASDGALAVVWQSKQGLNLSVSRDQGATWVPMEARDAGVKGGIDCPTIGADGKGNLIAIWLDGREGERGSASSALFASSLAPGAKKWGKNVKVNGEAIGACSCCFPHVAADTGGRFFVAFRGEEKNVREIQLYASDNGGKSFKGGPVSSDQWKMQGCPMAGPAVGVSADGKSVALAWRTKERMRGAVSRDGGKRFVDFDLASGAGMKDYPSVAFGGDGAALLLWTVERRWQGLTIAAPGDARKPLDPGLADGTLAILRLKDGKLAVLAAKGN